MRLNADTSQLLLIDFQERLMPAIDRGPEVVANAARLLTAARLLGVPALATEQYPEGLGHSVAALDLAGVPVVEKTAFNACAAPPLTGQLQKGRALCVAGAEAHVCVLQTVLALLESGHRVAVVADAVGSRREENRQAGLARMERAGAELVTTEMVLFEWLGNSAHPRFKEVMKLIK